MIAGDLVFVEQQLGQVVQSRQRRDVCDLVAAEVQVGQVVQSRQRRDVCDLVVVEPQPGQVGRIFETREVGDLLSGSFEFFQRSEVSPWKRKVASRWCPGVSQTPQRRSGVSSPRHEDLDA